MQYEPTPMYSSEAEPKKDYQGDIDALRKAMNSLSVKETSKQVAPQYTNYDTVVTPANHHHHHHANYDKPQELDTHVTPHNKHSNAEKPEERTKNRNKIMQPSFSFSNSDSQQSTPKNAPSHSPIKEKANLDLIK